MVMEETAEISFYNLLKKYKFSDEDASKFVSLQKKMQYENLATKSDLSEGLANVKSVLTWRLLMFWLGQVGIFLAFAYRIFPGM